MKKVVLVLVLTLFAFGADNDLYDNAVALHLGYGSTAGDSGTTYMLSIDRNLHPYPEHAYSLDALQFTLTYAALNTAMRDYAVRIGANGLWYFENEQNWVPYLKLGAGVQFFGGDESIDLSNHFYGTVGAGIEYQLRPDTSVIAELVDHYSFAKENSLRVSVGLKYSFGQSY
jgi:outer membrane autotransporter protein